MCPLIGSIGLLVLERLSDVLHQLIGGDMPDDPLELYQIAARAVVVYIVGVAVVRIGKSRLISRNTSLDVILGFILGSLLSRGITGHASISGTAVASAAIVGFHWLITGMACRWHGFGTLIKGHTRPIVENGRMLDDNMRRSHISEHDLFEELRLQGIDDIRLVKHAYKERNGQVSVIKRQPQPHVVNIAVRDGVQTVRVELA